MYSTVSSNFKNECKQDVNAYKRIAKIHVVEDDIDITNDDMLIDFTIEELAYSGDTFIGNSIAKKINLNIINDGSYNLENKEIEVYVGIDYVGDGSNVELVPYGNFIIAKPTNEEVKNTSNYVGYDYMIKAEKPYVEGNITYPISLYNYLSSVCTSLNIELGSSSIPNGNYQVIGNAYTNNESYRQVIEEIARCCGGFAVIGRDNKLYIKTLSVLAEQELSTEDEILIETEDDFLILTEKPQMSASYSDANSENLTPSQYFDDFNTSNSYGPVNKVALALNYNVIGEDTIMQDNDSIAENGIIEIRLSNVSFLNSETQRELAIQDLYDTLHNLNYIPFSTNYYGYPYIDSGDIIKLKSVKSGATYYSYALNHTFTYNGGFSGKLEAPALTDVENEYKEITDAKNAIRNTELRVNKIDGEISSIIEEIGDRSEKTTSITQDIDTIESKVYSEIDITRDATGNDPLTLYNAMKGYLLELHIYGNNQVFEQLYPSNDLYPSDDLYPMGDSRIHIFTDNKCPDSVNDWWNGYFNTSGIEYHNDPWNEAELICNFIPITELQCYLSLENSDYKFWSWIPYDENKTRIMSGMTTVNVSNYEKKVTFPTGTKYIRIGIVKSDYHYNETGYENNYPSITPAEILNIKPMITYSTEKLEYSGYNNSIIELGVTDVLRRFVKQDNTVVRDEYKLINNKGYVIRRVGIDGSGNLYDLETEITQELGETIIPVAEGKNYFNIVNYNANCKLVWVIRNNYTNTFATTVELESSITLLANSLNLQVSKKVNNNEVIARINMAILGRDEAEVPEDIEKSIIEIIANKIQITSDYFDLSKNGYITATGGTVGGITLSSNRLYKQYTQSNSNYESGLNLPSSIGSGGNDVFLYAGRPVGENLVLSNMFVHHNGNIYFRSGSLNMIYPPTVNQDGSSSWYNAMNFTADALNRYLPNGNRWTTEGIGYQSSVPSMHTLWLYDAKAYSIESGIHGTTLARFYRVGNNAEPAEIDFYANSYINGQQIQVATSDERMKENIEISDTNALDIIKDIDFYKFDWKKDSGNEGHIDVGFIAQRLKETYDKLVIHNITRENEIYSVDLLNTIALTMKGVQELNNKFNKQQDELNLLKEEIKKLKGEK